jgi:hypothetical protein
MFEYFWLRKRLIEFLINLNKSRPSFKINKYVLNFTKQSLKNKINENIKKKKKKVCIVTKSNKSHNF